MRNCDIRWVLSSDLNLVLLWQDLSLVGRWFQSLRAATEKDLSPQVRFEIGSFRSDMLLECKSPVTYCYQHGSLKNNHQMLSLTAPLYVNLHKIVNNCTFPLVFIFPLKCFHKYGLSTLIKYHHNNNTKYHNIMLRNHNINWYQQVYYLHVHEVSRPAITQSTSTYSKFAHAQRASLASLTWGNSLLWWSRNTQCCTRRCPVKM